jgi:uncharacterized protein (DUF1015 family)
MTRIAPFRGILYNSAKCRDPAKVVAPPYDVISPAEQERLHRKSPYNIVHLILSREGVGYDDVARLFATWQREDVLRRDDEPAIYFLSHGFADPDGRRKERLGFVALTRLEDFSSGKIRPHERTLARPKEDRFRLTVACRANLSPIFALYSEPTMTINQLLREETRGRPPAVEVTDDKGESCALWRVTDPAAAKAIQGTMADRTFLIADGHHRYEAALAFRDHMRAELGRNTGRESFNYVMAYFANMADEGLVILPIHRSVRQLPELKFQELEERLQRYFLIEPYPKTAEGKRSFLQALRQGAKRGHVVGASFRRDPRYLLLRLKNKKIMQRVAKELSEALRALDVTMLHTLVLREICGVSADAKVLEEIIRYSQDPEQVLRDVEEGESHAAFLLNPPSPEQILAVALGGDTMPQKSTYFYPKLLSGLVINKIDPEEEVAE